MPMLRKLFVPVVAFGLIALPTLALTGCEDKGPAEKAGESIDEAVQDTKRAVEDAAD